MCVYPKQSEQLQSKENARNQFSILCVVKKETPKLKKRRKTLLRKSILHPANPPSGQSIFPVYSLSSTLSRTTSKKASSSITIVEEWVRKG
jgi:hypothetical protein